MSQPSRRRLRIETNGETGRVGDDCVTQWVNLLKPNDIFIYMCRTGKLTSRRYILNIYSTNIHTEYFKHAA